MCDVYVFMLCYCYDMFDVCVIKVTALIRATLTKIKVDGSTLVLNFKSEL